MKVVVNRCHGGFGLSDQAVELCLERGMILTEYSEDGSYKDPGADFVLVPENDRHGFGKYYAISDHENGFRMNQTVVSVVEELGSQANGRFAKLEVVEIPFSSASGWEIDEYDGYERIEECHRSW